MPSRIESAIVAGHPTGTSLVSNTRKWLNRPIPASILVRIQMKIRKTTSAAKKYRFRVARAHGRSKNGHVHVISPATGSEIRKTLGIGRSQVQNIRRAFGAVGVEV